jgi:hypothetical protein
MHARRHRDDENETINNECAGPDVVSKKRQTGAASPEAAAIHRAQASICLDLAAKSREFWVTACLIDLAHELLSRPNRDR